jgi:hypothetical protein
MKNRIAIRKFKKNKNYYEKMRIASLFSRYTIDFLCEEGIKPKIFFAFSDNNVLHPSSAREPCPLCKGEGAEAQKCNDQRCPVWSAWGAWSQCSARYKNTISSYGR